MKRALQFIGVFVLAAYIGAFICSLATVAAYEALGFAPDIQLITRGWTTFLCGVAAGWYLFGEAA